MEPASQRPEDTSLELKHNRDSEKRLGGPLRKKSAILDITGASMGTNYSKKQLKLMKKRDTEFKKAHQLKAMHLLHDLKMQ